MPTKTDWTRIWDEEESTELFQEQITAYAVYGQQMSQRLEKPDSAIVRSWNALSADMKAMFCANNGPVLVRLLLTSDEVCIVRLTCYFALVWY